MILESSIAEDSIVVAFGTYTGTHKATGKSMTAAFAHRWEVVAGKNQELSAIYGYGFR